MWENCHDYDPEVEAEMKNPKPAPPVDLDRLDALFAAATPGEMTYGIRSDDSAWFSIGNHRAGPHIQGDIYCDESNLAFLAALRNNFPALAAELRTLRARVAELTAGAVELTDGTKEYNDLIAERDRLRAERDAANATVSGLREALEHQEAALCIIRDRQLGQVSVKDIDQGIGQIRAALSRTPDQHRARIEATGLRRLAEKMDRVYGEGQAAHCLTDEADRLERGE